MCSIRPRAWPTARAAILPIGLIPWVVGGLLGGCRDSSQQILVDSEQRRFALQCEKDGRCSVTAATPTETEPKRTGGAAQSFTLRATGRVVGICSVSVAGAAANLSDCRPLVCRSDAECPPADGLNHGVCINDLCTEPSHAVISDDAVLLCLAATGTPSGAALQVERFALGLNCGTPCRIPKPCHPL
jgi:hypothetical protein